MVTDNESPSDLNLTVISLVVSNILLGTVAFLLAWFICKSQRSINRGIFMLSMEDIAFHNNCASMFKGL